MIIQFSICWVVASQVDHYSTPFAALFLIDQSVFWSTNKWSWWVTAKYIRCSYIQKLMDQFLLFTVGPLLLSVKGIIDLAQMPPTILLPHPGGTGTPTLERIAYLPGAQPPFPPRAFNPTSISPGEDPSLPHTYTCAPLSSLPRSPCFLILLRVQPCTDLRCRRSVVPVHRSSWVSLQSFSRGDPLQNCCSATEWFSFLPKGTVLPNRSFLEAQKKILVWNVK